MSKLKTFVGFHELRTLHYYKALACEFLGTAILMVSGCGSCVTIDSGNPLSPVVPAFTFGMTVTYIVWTFNHVSGAHINPVVTCAFMITGHVSLVKTVGYTIAQCVGAVTGAAVIWHMVPDAWRATLGSTVFHPDVTLAQGFFVEAISTFIMVLGVFATSDRYRTDHSGSLPLTIGVIVFMQSAWAGRLTGCSMNPARTLGPAVISGSWDHHWGFFVEAISTFIMVLGVFATSDRYRTDHSGSLPLTIGVIVFMQSAWAGRLTGCSMNPARTLGPAVISGSWDHHWVYWVAPAIGASVASLLYEHALAESPQEANMSIHVEANSHDQDSPAYLQKFTDQTIVIYPPNSRKSLVE